MHGPQRLVAAAAATRCTPSSSACSRGRSAPTSSAAAPIVLRSTWLCLRPLASGQGPTKLTSAQNVPSHSLAAMATRRPAHLTSHDVWLPIPPDEIEGLPDGLRLPLLGRRPGLPRRPGALRLLRRPLHEGRGGRRAPAARMTPGAGRADAHRRHRPRAARAVADLPAGAQLCNARGVHDASTAELALTLILASLRGIPDFVRAQDAEEWRPGFRPALADKSVLIVGYGSIGSAIEDRLAPFECARVARVARSARTTVRGPVHPLADLPALLPDADVVILATPLTDATRGLVGRRLPGPDEGRRAAGERRARRGRRHQGAARRAGVAAGCAPRSMSPTPNRCPPGIRCGTLPACSSPHMSAAPAPPSCRVPSGCCATS